MDESPSGSWGSTSEEILRNQFPMHRACRDGDVQTLSSLLGDFDDFGPANGLFVEDTFYGWTPAHWAAYFGKLPCLVRLIEHGEVSCNVTTFRFHQSPVHIAAFGGHGHCLQWLLQRGAQIHRQDYLGETCLHKAARTGSMECISLLVSQGAKLGATNYNKQTAAQVASACGFPECTAYLERCLQLQQPLRGIFQELLAPVSHPPAPVYFPSCPSLSSQNPEQCNAIVQGFNRGCIPNTEQNGISNGHSRHEDDEDSMDTTEDPTANVNGNSNHRNGLSNGDVTLSNGISLNYVPVAGRKRGREDVDVECLKRIRRGDLSDSEQRISVDGVESVAVTRTDFVNPNFGIMRKHSQASTPTSLGNGHHTSSNPGVRDTCSGLPVQLNGDSNGFPITNSALEHHSTVTMQNGYDSLVVDCLISSTHRC